MLNRTTIPQSIADSLEARPGAWGAERWRNLAESIYIPETARAYALFLMGLIVLAGTMVIHVLLSAELMHLRIRLNDVNEKIAQVQRLNDNLVYQIADHSALDAVHAAALEQGYVPMAEPIYVVRDAVAPSASAPSPGAAPAVATADGGEGPPTLPARETGGGWRDWWASYWQEVRGSGSEFLHWFRPRLRN